LMSVEAKKQRQREVDLEGEQPEIVQRLKALLEKYKSDGRSAPRTP